jgi:hypothetical protein
MKFHKFKAILLSLVPIFGTACILGSFPNSVQAAPKNGTQTAPECPNIEGAMQRSSDNLVIYWTQRGCNIRSNAPTKGVDHIVKGHWTGDHFSVTTTRRNLQNGCTTQMYGNLYKLDDSQLRTEVYGTDGRCDLPANYTESSLWTAR